MALSNVDYKIAWNFSLLFRRVRGVNDGRS